MRIIIKPDELTPEDKEAVTAWYKGLQASSGYVLPCGLECNQVLILKGEGTVMAETSCLRRSAETVSQTPPPVRPGSPGVHVVTNEEATP